MVKVDKLFSVHTLTNSITTAALIYLIWYKEAGSGIVWTIFYRQGNLMQRFGGWHNLRAVKLPVIMVIVYMV